ncbi:response regulator transcription factor [Shewanella youngdeokensis]|uniref:Response regulator transcription factor n=1 Tax=Shewanella youngdeokensis TaxID=2999068 RepID=A0ABZ0JZ12_9GAMM|nr:response regulator transcription factor [Shewanella sp. DAU334]
MRVLLVKDHLQSGLMLQKSLQRSGYTVDLAESASTAYTAMQRFSYDALLLDLSLPNNQGTAILQTYQGQLPCVVLPARDPAEQRVASLCIGADNYLLNPAEMSKLEAYIKAILRRPEHREEQNLVFADLHYDPQTRLLTGPSGYQVLVRREAILIEALMQAAPRTVIKDNLEKNLYDSDEEASANAVEAVVSRFRRKLSALNSSCQLKTFRGIGYGLVKSMAE